MGDAAIEDMDTADCVFSFTVFVGRADCFDAISEFGKHPSPDDVIFDEVFGFRSADLGDKSALIGKIAVEAFDISQKYQFIGTNCFGNGAGGIIGIYIVGIVIFIKTYRGDDGKKVVFD